MLGTSCFTNYFNGDQSILRVALNKGYIYYFGQVMSCYRQFSAGSYNERYASLAPVEKEMHWVRKAEGELLYDEYTFGRFHEWIIRYVSKTVVNAGLIDNSLLEGFLKDTNLKREEMLSYCSIKLRSKYYLHFYFPKVYSCLKQVKNTIIKNDKTNN